MIERLDHIALLTADVARAARFYCDWAGMRIIHDRCEPGHTHRVIWVRLAEDDNSLILVLIQSEEPGPDGWPRGAMNHFGFHVSSRADVDAIAARARGLGILEDEPQYAGPIVGYFCTIRDPDGNLLEFSCEQLKA
ncbi:MAG: VOC family protein [Blastocatellia bacterium]|nr:VOC family protein [Blastocatellia bacterium]